MKKINQILSLIYIYYITSADWCSCSNQVKKQFNQDISATKFHHNNLVPNSTHAYKNGLIEKAQDIYKKYEAANQATQDSLNRFTPPGGGSGGSVSCGGSRVIDENGQDKKVDRSSNPVVESSGSEAESRGIDQSSHSEAVYTIGDECGNRNTIRPRGRSHIRSNNRNRPHRDREPSRSPISRSRSQSQDHEYNVVQHPNLVSCWNSQYSVVDQPNQPSYGDNKYSVVDKLHQQNDWSTSSEDYDACSTSSSDSDLGASFLTSLTKINGDITDSVNAMESHYKEISTASELNQIASDVRCTDMDATIQAVIQQKAEVASVDTSQHHNQLSVHVHRTIETIDRQKQACLEWVSLYFHAYPIHSNKRYTSSTTLQIQPSKQLYELSKNYDITCTFQQSDDSRGINKITILLTPEALTASNISRLLDTTSTWNVYKVDITITPKTNPAIQSTLAQIEQSLNHTATTATLPTCSIDPYATSPTYLIARCHTMCKALQDSIKPTTKTICFYKDANRYIEASTNIRSSVEKNIHSVEAGLARCKKKVEHPHSRMADLLPLLIHPVNALSEMIQSKNELASWVLPDPYATHYNNVQDVSRIIDESIATCSKQITQALTTYNQKMDTETNMMARNFMELVWQDKPIDLAQFKKDYGNYTVCIGWKETDPIMHQPQEMVWKIDVAQVSMENLKTLLTAYRHSQPQGNPKNVMIFIQPKIPEAMQQSIQKLQVQALTYPHNHAIQPYTRGVLAITDIEKRKLQYAIEEELEDVIDQLEETTKPIVFKTETSQNGQLILTKVTDVDSNFYIGAVTCNEQKSCYQPASIQEKYPCLNRLLDRLTTCDQLKGKQVVNHLMAALQAIGFTPYTPEQKIQTQITDAFDTVCNHLTMIELTTLQQAMQETLQLGGDKQMGYQVLNQNQRKIDGKIEEMARQTKQIDILTTLAQRYYGIEITPLQPIVQKLKKQYEQTTTDTEQLTFEGMSQRFIYMQTAMHDCLSEIADKIADTQEVNTYDLNNYKAWLNKIPTPEALIGDLTDNIIREKITRMHQIIDVIRCQYVYHYIHKYYTVLSTNPALSELYKRLEQHHGINNKIGAIKNCNELEKYGLHSEIYKNAWTAFSSFIKQFNNEFLESLSTADFKLIFHTATKQDITTYILGHNMGEHVALREKLYELDKKINTANKHIQQMTDCSQQLCTGFGSISFFQEEVKQLDMLQNKSNKTVAEVAQHSTNLDAAVKHFLSVVQNKMASEKDSTLNDIRHVCTGIENTMYQESINTIIEQCTLLLHTQKESNKPINIEQPQEEEPQKEAIRKDIHRQWARLSTITGNLSKLPQNWQEASKHLETEIHRTSKNQDLTLEALRRKQGEIQKKIASFTDYLNGKKSELKNRPELKRILHNTPRTPVIRNTGTPVIRNTGTPVTGTTRTPVIRNTRTLAIRTTRTPAIRTTRTPAIRTTRTPVIRTTRTSMLRNTKSTVGNSQPARNSYPPVAPKSQLQNNLGRSSTSTTVPNCPQITANSVSVPPIHNKIQGHLKIIQDRYNRIKDMLHSYKLYEDTDQNANKIKHTHIQTTQTILHHIDKIFTHILHFKHGIETILRSDSILSKELKQYICNQYKALAKAIDPNEIRYQLCKEPDNKYGDSYKQQTQKIVCRSTEVMFKIVCMHKMDETQEEIEEKKRNFYATNIEDGSDPKPDIERIIQTLRGKKQANTIRNTNQIKESSQILIQDLNQCIQTIIKDRKKNENTRIQLLDRITRDQWWIGSGSF